MNVEFKEWIWCEYRGRQSSELSLMLSGVVDFVEPVYVWFQVTDLSELFGVQHDEKELRGAVEANREFLEKIARAWVRAGGLKDDGTLTLYKDDLRPYFERRAANAPA